MTALLQPGVQYVAPPIEAMPGIMASVNKALADLPPEAHGALVGVATTAGWNAAIVARGPAGFNVHAWIGSKWGDSVEAGAEVMKSW